MFKEMLCAALIKASFRGALSRGRSWATRKFRSRPSIERFKLEFLPRFGGIPNDDHPSYYHSKQHLSGDVDKPSGEIVRPTFLFFAEKEVVIEEFMGLLIPPLDYGHGRQRGLRSGDLDHVIKFDEHWDEYLRRLGEKAKERWLLDSRRKTFRRIVFIERQRLKEFIDDPHAARGTLQYASDLVAIHRRVWAQRDYIDCYYLDKKLVTSEKYYDVGVYRIDGIDVVYKPVYKKNENKGLEGEVVVIGETKVQRQRIQEHKDNFRDLWALAAEFGGDQPDIARTSREKEMDWEVGQMHVEYFNKLYYRGIMRSFRRIGVKLPPRGTL